MSRRTFATDPGAGGEESEAQGFPFVSTPCEDWYGFGNARCPNRYKESGNLETDIKSLIKWIGFYNKGSWWWKQNSDELYRKRAEQSKILAKQKAEETSLPSIYGGQFVPPPSPVVSPPSPVVSPPSPVVSPPQIQLSSEIQKIINDWHDHILILPSWFANNNVNWVITGDITEAEFLSGFNNLLNQHLAYYITEPEPEPTITDNMVTQQVINFNIVNGRAVGSIKFVATNNFNPFYYGKNIVNIIQFKEPNGATILTFVKENRLNFTETERTETIQYDEDMQGNTRATVESNVWLSATTPAGFSKTGSWDISEKEQPKPLTTGFMSAGVAGAIAGLVLLGFIIDHKVSKR